MDTGAYGASASIGFFIGLWASPSQPGIFTAGRPTNTVGKAAGRWRYVYRAVDQHGQVIDVYVSVRRDTSAARRFFITALAAHATPAEVVTDRAWTLRTVIDELIPSAFHNIEQYANHRIEADHGRLKARFRPMRGPKSDRTASVVVRGHALMQNIRRGQHDQRPGGQRTLPATVRSFVCGTPSGEKWAVPGIWPWRRDAPSGRPT